MIGLQAPDERIAMNEDIHSGRNLRAVAEHDDSRAKCGGGFATRALSHQRGNALIEQQLYAENQILVVPF